MKRWALFAVPLCLAVFLFSAGRAEAALHVCNKTTEVVDVAIAIGTMDPDGAGGTDTSQGWWTLQPGECKTPIGGNLSYNTWDNVSASVDDDMYFYSYYAESNTDTWAGDGTRNMYCIDPQNRFYYDDQDQYAGTCTKRSFRELKTDGSADYTLTLTP